MMKSEIVTLACGTEVHVKLHVDPKGDQSIILYILSSPAGFVDYYVRIIKRLGLQKPVVWMPVYINLGFANHVKLDQLTTFRNLLNLAEEKAVQLEAYYPTETEETKEL